MMAAVPWHTDSSEATSNDFFPHIFLEGSQKSAEEDSAGDTKMSLIKLA